MKRVFIFALLLSLYVSAAAFAEEEKIVFANNEYGGVTKQITFSVSDASFGKGMQKIVASFDNQGNKKKMEVYATKNHSEKTGWYKKVIYYWGRKKVSEAYSTDSDSAKYGFYKMVSYFNEDNGLEKREYFLNEDSQAARLGVYKRVVHYDGTEKMTRVEDLDSQGNVILIE